MRRDDNSSTAQRVRELLDRSLTGATGSATPGGSTADPADPFDPADVDDVWPAEWPPGSSADHGGELPDARLDARAGSDRPGLMATAGARWQVPGRAAAAAGTLALLVVVALVVLLLREPSSGTPVPARDPLPFPSSSSGLPGAADSTPGASGDPLAGAVGGTGLAVDGTAQPAVGQYRVYVVGQVKRPGVVSLAPGARVEDAVDAAGGVTAKADLTVMNLARKVVDGERIVVPKPGEQVPTDDPAAAAGPEAAAGAGGSAAPGAPVDLNTATVAELDALPGVGPVIAGRIVAWRQQNGRFNRVDDLAEVSGIGDATLEKLRPLVRV